jgi:hypothetical protein
MTSTPSQEFILSSIVEGLRANYLTTNGLFLTLRSYVRLRPGPERVDGYQ